MGGGTGAAAQRREEAEQPLVGFRVGSRVQCLAGFDGQYREWILLLTFELVYRSCPTALKGPQALPGGQAMAGLFLRLIRFECVLNLWIPACKPHGPVKPSCLLSLWL